MKIKLLKEWQDGKHLRQPGFLMEVTNEAGRELIKTDIWEEVSATTFDPKLPRSKSNPKPVKDKE